MLVTWLLYFNDRKNLFSDHATTAIARRAAGRPPGAGRPLLAPEMQLAGGR